jgi:hypothetical protein
MRALIAAAFAAAFFAAPGAQAQQREAPYDMWCRDVATSEGLVFICMARTREQCLASRTSPGESCYLNPRYDPRFRRQ